VSQRADCPDELLYVRQRTHAHVEIRSDGWPYEDAVACMNVRRLTVFARARFAVWRDERGAGAALLPSDLSGPHVPYEVPVRDIVTGRVLWAPARRDESW
jgi:hypothetical protein